VRANVAAVDTLYALQGEGRAATLDEQAILARWSGWGAVPAVFDAKAADYERFAPERARLQELLSVDDYAAAQRNTLNAHYTDTAYADAIWRAARELGFEEGRVLEPGCGSGNFLRHAGEHDHVVGVELDPTTAAIAARLHPRADVRAESFAETRLPEGSIDLVVGNVPFGDIKLHDRRHNQGGHAIHNHFLVKSLHLTRPGGLAAVITSRYTMDAANPAARRELAELGDLVGAVRLPTGAHRRTAGTDVVTDVLVFRRREADQPAAGFAFEQALPIVAAGSDEPLRINQYFLEHPEHVLGSLQADQADRGRLELGVAGDRDAGPALTAALASIVDRARDRGLTLAPRTADSAERAPVGVALTSSQRPEGFIASVHGGFTRVEDGIAVAHSPAPSQTKELHALLCLRDTAVALLEAEASTIEDTPTLTALRQQLNEQYDAYARAHGALNRFSVRRTGRTDPETGEDLVARIRPPQGGFRRDPFSSVVYALEHFDPATQSATKATIFRERVVARRPPQLGADTPADALAISLDTYGEARLLEIARLLGLDEREARAQLATLVFDEPGTNRLVPAAEYLSGNVRTKLAEALAAAAKDARFAANVDALGTVQPRDLGPSEIHAQLGTAWISSRYVQEFLRETLDDPTVYVDHAGGSLWSVKSSQRGSVAARAKWGTEKYSAVDIAQALLEQRQVRIYDEKPDGERVFNINETIAATEKARELNERFSEWVWEKPERASELARLYNDRFNAIVPRSYDGSHLSLPGLALSFKPRFHQVAAVARIINEPAVGLFHEVGAGKTAEMVMGAMELRRLRLVSKPAVVVPNHMLEQFSREWLQLYPQAKILAASNEDLDREHRRLFIAKCATNDWDAVIMTRSAFERIPMSPDAQKEYLSREVDSVTSMIERVKADDSRFSLKRLERMRLNTEERIKTKLDSAKDPGICFEQLGIDYIFADEAHAYKNLRTPSNIPGMAVDGSQRATDLDMKLGYLRERHPRVGTLATATPLANSMGEVYTMMRYLRPDLLEAAEIRDHDQWAATFGETVTSIEVAPDGSGLRMQTRFAKFRNVPELLQMWRVSADIKTAEDLQLPVPALAPRPDGQRVPEVVVVPPSSELQEYVKQLAERADLVRSRQVAPTTDNLLSISSDGRAAGLDLRLVGVSTDERQKTDVAAERIAAIYEAKKHHRYPGPGGGLHPTPGALQLVFSDLGTPRPGEWTVYEHLRSQLVARGVPRDAVRFVHEAKNDREKAELFAACRDGRISVLIGSTERMGVGTNVQLRCVAQHDLDCPWRPADIAQRAGRIIRQGNANPEVQIVRYVTEGSFDAYLWQTVTRKAKFIAQVMRGKLDVREIEDIGDAALSYNEVKALATGNPLLLEHAAAQAELNRLERLERSHDRTQATLHFNTQSYGQRIRYLEQRITETNAALTHLAAAGEGFQMTVGSRGYSKAPEANEHLRQVLLDLVDRRGRMPSHVQVASFQGLPVLAINEPSIKSVHVSLRGVPGSELTLEEKDLEGARLVTRLQNTLKGLPDVRDNDLRYLGRVKAELDSARAEIGAPFKHAHQLADAHQRFRDLDAQLHAAVAPPTPSPPAELTPEQREEQGRVLATRWNDLLAHELQQVRHQAEALERRLTGRAAALRERLAEHHDRKPPKPSSLTILTGGRAEYEAAIERWTADRERLERTTNRVEARRAVVNPYLLEHAPGCSSRAGQLAAERVSARYPDLASELTEHTAWRQAQMRERTAAQVERVGRDTSPGRGR
jgi:N12 class adenine-specific DNA methylase/predicted RNA methylase